MTVDWWWVVAVVWWLVGCRPGVESPALVGGAQPTAVPQVTIQPTRPSLPSPPPTLTPIPTYRAVATFTPTATAAPTITPTLTVTPTNIPSPTPPPSCIQRVPQDDLLLLVTRTYGLSQDYAPADLVPLADYFPVTVTLGFPTEARLVIIEPLRLMIEAMQAAGLQPTIVSGYRSYSAQALAREKWLVKNPQYGAYLTALPGHSEHQLGTTLDFGSPDLDNELTHEFANTDEGIWLLAHAHEYGFTLSYPRDAYDVTGFYYEPWHYRYVGAELGRRLQEQGVILTEYLLNTQPAPCRP